MHTARLPPCLLVLLLTALPLPAAFGQISLSGEAAQVLSGSAAQGLSLDLDALIKISGRPPEPGSSGLLEDLAILRWLQSYRTPQLVGATWLTLGREPAVFSAALGVDMDKSTPGITAGLRQFLALADAAGTRIKNRIQRSRPYLSHHDLRPCLPPEAGYSFPSGHASWYAAAATLLSDLLPERRQRLELVGQHGATNRVICGMHYPSDVEAGQRFGRAAAAQIIASSQWRRWRQDPAIRSELGQVLQAHPEALPLLLP